MDMKSDKFSELCEQFMVVLQKKETLNKKEEEVIEKVIQESQKLLESALDSKKSRIKNGLVQQLGKAIDQFEGSHPSLTANMEKMVERLCISVSSSRVGGVIFSTMSAPYTSAISSTINAPASLN